MEELVVEFETRFVFEKLNKWEIVARPRSENS